MVVSFSRTMVLMMSFLFLPLALMAAADAGDDRKQVRIETSLGTMVVELFDETPEHRDNFLKLVKEGFYQDLLWHRVISGFMAQGVTRNPEALKPECGWGQEAQGIPFLQKLTLSSSM